MRNPDWVRDEVILAMDLYFRAGRRQLPPEHQDVILLSDLLSRLPIHARRGRDETFRNPNGISMILGNFLGVDPEHETPGLSRNNRLQEEVWREFAGRPKDLRQVADAIARACAILPQDSVRIDEPVEDEVLPEGRVLTRLHLLRERSRALVERKRERTLARTGRLACEVCDFDFARVYGELGIGFVECHHLVPLAELPRVRTTRLTDLAIVCANCHRMLHRTRPTITIIELRTLIRLPGRPGSAAPTRIAD